jgi:hypothetical protein
MSEGHFGFNRLISAWLCRFPAKPPDNRRLFGSAEYAFSFFDHYK